jgi:flavin-dependent dehydrogenase
MEKVTPENATPEAAPSAYDLIVVGGGPGGSSTAITAARAGARVLLLERGRLPRQRVCGEFVSAESLQLLAGLLGDSASSLLTGAVRVSRARLFVDGHTIATPVDPAGASIARFDLDSALWHAALQAGVDARLQTAVEGVHRNGAFQVRTTAGDFIAQAVVVAAGRRSNLDAPPCSAEPVNRWLGLKAHFTESSPPPSVDLYFFEGGYCGVQPLGFAGNGASHGRVNACAMVRADVAHTLPEVFALHPQLRERSRQWEPMTEPVSTSQLQFHEPQPVHDGMLRVGDSAGFVDPFVGDGISLALRSGAAAAESLFSFFRGNLSLEDATSRYDRIYRRRLLPVFRNSSKLRQLLRLPRTLRIPIAHLLENAPAMTRHLVTLTR